MNGKFHIVALDIETAHAPSWAVQHEIDQAISKVSRNKAKIYKTPEKQVEERQRIEVEYLEKCEEAEQKIREKSALSLVAPIACIGIVADGRQFHFSTFKFTDEEQIMLLQHGIYPFTFSTIPDMLKGLAWFFDSLCGFDTQYVGHNAWGFDYSRLRLAYLREGLRIPFALSKENKQNCHDTMQMFRWFSGDQFTSLENMCVSLDISFNKSMTGAEVPIAIENKEFLKVILYNLADTWACYEAFLKMQQL